VDPAEPDPGLRRDYIHGLMMHNGNTVSEISVMGSTFGWEMDLCVVI
jgi:hypothetical protein